MLVMVPAAPTLCASAFCAKSTSNFRMASVEGYKGSRTRVAGSPIMRDPVTFGLYPFQLFDIRLTLAPSPRKVCDYPDGSSRAGLRARYSV